MNRQLNPLAFFAPLLYVAIIFGLVYLQFSGAGIFTNTLGNISLSGTLDFSNSEDEPGVASAYIEYEGLRFNFDNQNPLVIEQQGGRNTELYINGYQMLDNQIVLYFDDDIQLVFANDSDAEQLVISNNIGDELGGISTLRLPFRTSTGVEISPTDNFPGLDISTNDTRYILALPPRSYVNLEDGLLNIPGDGLDRNIRYTRRAAGNENVFDLWFQNQLEEIPEEVFTGEIDAYIERAYLAWRSNRYNSSSGTWSMRDDGNRFSEEILISLLAEAWERNEYSRAFNDMRAAADIFPMELTYRSSAFLGNLRRVTNDLDAQERQENIRISNMINQANPMVFLKLNLFQYVVDRGTTTMLNSLVSFTESLPSTNLNSLEALGLLANYYLGNFPDEDHEALLSRFTPLLEDRIMSEIVRVDEGFFFQTEQGISDSYYSVLAGEILIAAGAKEGNSQMVTLGENLLLSVIRLSDQMGFLPEQIELTAGAISATSGTTPPEDIYPLITDNPYYPRELSLSAYFGPGAWSYSIVSAPEITSTPGEFTLEFDNTPNRTHYLFMRGIPQIDPLNGMELFGIIWRNAPDFEIYSKGRYYNTDSETMMIKFFDDDPEQTIRLFY